MLWNIFHSFNYSFVLLARCIEITWKVLLWIRGYVCLCDFICALSWFFAFFSRDSFLVEIVVPFWKSTHLSYLVSLFWQFFFSQDIDDKIQTLAVEHFPARFQLSAISFLHVKANIQCMSYTLVQCFPPHFSLPGLFCLDWLNNVPGATPWWYSLHVDGW